MYPWNKYVCVGKKECAYLQRENPTAIPPPKHPHQSQLFALSWDKFVAER
jgi:hypothetical protein